MTILLNFFYRLPLKSIAVYFVVLTRVYLIFRQRLIRCRRLRCGLWFALALWVFLTLWITTFGRTPGPAHPPELIPFHSYRKLISTGFTEIIRTNFLNIVLFFPAGLLFASLLPEKWSHGQKILSAGVAFALFSLMIEYIQFNYALGEPEIDDIIHNTLGAILGTLPIIFQDIRYKPTWQSPNE